MTETKRFFGGARRWRLASGTAGGLMLLVLAVAMVALPSCDVFGGGEPDVVLSGGQDWSGREWSVQVDGAEWDGCMIGVELTITNNGASIANFGYPDVPEELGYLYVRDKYGEVFEPHKNWPWETQFYEEKFYPGEVRSGTVEYQIDPRSEQIRMYMVPDFPEARELSFDLGAVPGSCE